MNALLLYWKPLAVAVVLGLASWFFYGAGADSVRAEYAARDTAAASKYAKDLSEAISQRDQAIKLHNDFQTEASKAYQVLEREKQNAEEKAVRAVATGTRKLYVLAKCPAANGVSAVPQAPADPNGPTAAVRIELEPGVGADIKRFGNRINQLQRQYNYCYQTLENDRK